MATVYHRDDAGAPVLTYANAQSAQLNFDSLKTILKACLVSGYGSKAAAGWELISESSNHIVLRNGSKSGYVCFSWAAGSQLTTIYLAATYTGVSGGVMTGDGLKTGTAANNSAPQKFFSRYLSFASASTTWHMVADSKTFLLQMTANLSNTSVLTFSGAIAATAYCPALYVGEDSQGNFVSIGGQNTASTSAADTRFNSSGFTALRYPASGLLVDAGAITVATPGLQVTPSPGSVIQLAEVTLAPAAWSAAGVMAGRLRGIALPPFVMAEYPYQAALSLGLSTGLDSRNANNFLNLGDGYAYFVASSDYRDTTRLHTTNPSFW